MNRRPERLASTIQKELGMMILRELNDPRLTGMPSITRVKVTPDLEYADIYVSVMGTQGQQSAALNALKHSAGLMRTRLTKDLSLRQAPFIRFHLDTELKKEIEMMALLDQVARENAELDRKRAEQAGQQDAASQAKDDDGQGGSHPPDASS